MEKLIIQHTDETPSVTLDKDNGVFHIGENSYPDDALRFYHPVIEWIKKYCQDPNPETVFEFAFSYFNTSSEKIITKMLDMLKGISSKTALTIKWRYESDDTDMHRSGIRFSQLCGMHFEFEEIEC